MAARMGVIGSIAFLVIIFIIVFIILKRCNRKNVTTVTYPVVMASSGPTMMAPMPMQPTYMTSPHMQQMQYISTPPPPQIIVTQPSSPIYNQGHVTPTYIVRQ